MNALYQPIPEAEAACPQCGALVAVPYRSQFFSCSWCGSSLSAGGLRVYRLKQHPRLTVDSARQAVKSWMTGAQAPPDLLSQAAGSLQVGELSAFPFMRIRGQGRDRVLPLARLPLPEVMELPSVPADLRPAGATAGETIAHPVQRVPIEEELLRPRLQEAAHDPTTQELLLEERLYFPVRYSYGGGHFSAVVDAGAGSVLALRRPGRRGVMGERLLAPPVALLLMGEAVLIPTLAGKLATIALSAVSLFLALRWLVGRHG